jgi:hypothetical protein
MIWEHGSESTEGTDGDEAGYECSLKGGYQSQYVVIM